MLPSIKKNSVIQKEKKMNKAIGREKKKSRREKEPSEVIAVDVVKHIALNCFIAVFYVRARMLFLPFFSSEKYQNMRREELILRQIHIESLFIAFDVYLGREFLR